MKKGAKTGTIVAIVCWSVVALLLISFLVLSLTGSFGGHWFSGFSIGSVDFGGGAYTVQGKYEVEAKGIDNINVQWTAGDVKVAPYDGETLCFEEGARRELEDKYKLSYEVNGSTLNIKYMGSFQLFSWNIPSKQLELKIPKELAEKLSDLSIDSTSANVTVSSIKAKTGKLHSVSGETMAQSSEFGELRLEATSGDTTITGVKAGTVHGSSVSGNIDLHGSLASADLSTTSGEIYVLSDKLENFRGNSVSGDICVESDACPKNAEFNTTSGGARLIIPENSGFTASFHSVSGDLHCDFPVIKDGDDSVYKDGGANFKFNTVSGDGDISKK